MTKDEKVKLELNHVKFDRSRFRRYIGNIGEMIAQEVLLKEGFEVWLLTPYFPEVSPAPPREERQERIKLKAFFGDKLEAFKQYMEKIGVIGKFGILGAALIKTGTPKGEYVYTPDLIAKKDGKIYVVEVKATKGALRYLKRGKLKGLMLAKDYGFSPMLVTLNVNIEASDFTITEL